MVKNKIVKRSKSVGVVKKSMSGVELVLLNNYLTSSVRALVPKEKFAVFFSGGVDSTLISNILKEQKKDFVCCFAYISDFSEPKDLFWAKNVSQFLGIELIEAPVSLNQFEKELPKIVSTINSFDPVQVGVVSAIYFAGQKIKKSYPKINIVFSGLGADELFAGYDKFKKTFKKSVNVNNECKKCLNKLYEKDLINQNKICESNNLELRTPFLDKKLVSFALSLDPKFKLNKNGENKIILRELALSLGLPKDTAYRKKTATQYGSNFDKALEFLAKKNNFKTKTDYLNSIINKNNLSQKNFPIAALISTGKDSIFAMHLMQKQGALVKCLITIDSKNKDSFMFHTPTINIAKLQASSMNLPLIIVKTKGEKEKELKELKKAIVLAKKKHNIKGLCFGSLFSIYQKERIEKICLDLGISAFAPLWHKNQVNYLKELVENKFEIIITKIAAYGFDENWVGKKIDSNSIKELIALEEKYKINPAGEGGEYETLVIDTPFFSKKIDLLFDKKMKNEFTGEIKIKKAKLVEK